MKKSLNLWPSGGINVRDDLNPSRLNDCVQSVSIAVSHHFPENPCEVLHESFLARLSRFPVAVHHLSRVFGSKATNRSEVWVVSPNSGALPLPFPVSKGHQGPFHKGSYAGRSQAVEYKGGG